MKQKARNVPPAFTATCGPGQHLEAIFNSVSDGIFALDTRTWSQDSKNRRIRNPVLCPYLPRTYGDDLSVESIESIEC